MYFNIHVSETLNKEALLKTYRKEIMGQRKKIKRGMCEPYILVKNSPDLELALLKCSFLSIHFYLRNSHVMISSTVNYITVVPPMVES